MRGAASAQVVLAVCVFAGCSSSPSAGADAGAPGDAALGVDAAVPADSSLPDSGVTPDASAMAADSGAADAGPDGGMAPVDGGADAGAVTDGSYAWTQIGPPGGWIPALVYDPTTPGLIWASGDDGSGLYRSNDYGATWSAIQTGAQNQSTYSLRIDPNNANVIYAPNHFGRGMLASRDHGSTWTAAQAGLPLTGSDTQLLNDLAVKPGSSSVVIAGTNSGLYKSTDGASSFSLVATTLAGVVAVSAVAYRSDGILFVGKADGTVGFSGDDGATWTGLLTASGLPIEFLVFSSTSLYLGYAGGTIYKLDKQTFAGGPINDTTKVGAIVSTNRTAFSVLSGATAATDTLLVGTSGNSMLATSQWGVFISTNGGTSWTQATNGLSGTYAMSVAIDPNNANNMAVGSTNGYGIFYSRNAGSSWTNVTANLYATTSLGLAQDPSNGSHLLASSTACASFSADFETTNGGATWTRFNDPAPDDGSFALSIDPQNGAILDGMCTLGVYRSTAGTGGPWTQVLTTGGHYVDRIVRDAVNSAVVYVVVPAGAPGQTLFVSTTGGTAFAPASGTIWSVSVHPTHANEAVATTPSDVYASTNAFTAQTALGLASLAASEGGLTAAAFDPANPSTLVVGGAHGGLYKTSSYSPSGIGVSWSKLAAPIQAAPVRDIVIAHRGSEGVYYVATAGGQTGFGPTSTVGVFRSLDQGATWSSLSQSMFPCTLTWRMLPDLRAPTTTFLLGMWSGGLLQLVDTQ